MNGKVRRFCFKSPGRSLSGHFHEDEFEMLSLAEQRKKKSRGTLRLVLKLFLFLFQCGGLVGE